MQGQIYLLAVIAIFLLAVIMAQAYESQYGSDQQEDRREFLRRLLNAFDQEENMDRRCCILERCLVFSQEATVTSATSPYRMNKYD